MATQYFYRCAKCDLETQRVYETGGESYIDCQCGEKIGFYRIILGASKEKSDETLYFQPVVHEHFDDSTGEIIKGRSHIKQICRERNKRYLSVQESNQEAEMYKRRRETEYNCRQNDFAKNFLKALHSE